MIFLALSLLFATSYSMASEENNSGQIVPSLDAMNKHTKLSLVEYYCQSQHNLSSSFSKLPQELQLHILNFIPIPQVLFEKKRFNNDNGVLSACFNNNGTRVLTTSRDNTAHVWDSSSGDEIQHFNHNSLVSSACFNKNETCIVTASGNKTARVWQKDTSWTLDQRLLCNLLFAWLSAKKTHESVNSIYDFIATTRIYEKIDPEHVIMVWKSFPEQIQAAIWQKIKLSIDKYGKIESSLQKLEQKTEPTTSLEYSLLSSQKTLFFGGIMILMCAFAINRFH